MVSRTTSGQYEQPWLVRIPMGSGGCKENDLGTKYIFCMEDVLRSLLPQVGPLLEKFGEGDLIAPYLRGELP